jgi:hypothetical protein
MTKNTRQVEEDADHLVEGKAVVVVVRISNMENLDLLGCVCCLFSLDEDNEVVCSGIEEETMIANMGLR